MRPAPFTTALLLVVSLGSTRAAAQSGENVLVVANETSAISVQIARAYAAARRVPDEQIVRVRIPVSDQISRADYERQIQTPIATWLGQRSAQDRILYLVLTSGIPVRIAGTGGRTGTAGSVDSELALLYRRLAGVSVPAAGPVANPYHLGEKPIESGRHFSHAIADIYLVSRLDGFTVEDVLAVVDRSAKPATTGRIVLDAPATLNDPRTKWIEAAETRLKGAGFGDRVVLETTSLPAQNEPEVIGYYSWGSNDPALAVRRPGVTFQAGALAATFLSTDARTFTEPPADWKPGRPYAGSSQSLIGDFIRQGATGVGGNVAEPYLDGAIRPDILFPAYLAGFNLAEAFFLATPFLSWQTVVIGDPLCAPFRTAALSADDLTPPIDPDTELPARFSARRLSAVHGLGNEAALKHLLRSEARVVRDDWTGAREALEKAVAADDRLLIGWRALGLTNDHLGRHSAAVEAYRRALALDRNDVVSLNNLAYNLAVREAQPREALPFAERAALLARGNPTVDDTLGWIKHLLGDDQGALRLLGPASRAAPLNADILLHTAVVYAAVGRLEDAAKALGSARELDAAIQDRPEYGEVRRKISGGGSLR